MTENGAYEGVRVGGHHCPMILRSGSLRYGAWAVCRCGWQSSPCTTTGGASVAWALHVRDRARRALRNGTKEER